jgi:hypothetical protein
VLGSWLGPWSAVTDSAQVMVELLEMVHYLNTGVSTPFPSFRFACRLKHLRQYGKAFLPCCSSLSVPFQCC